MNTTPRNTSSISIKKDQVKAGARYRVRWRSGKDQSSRTFLTRDAAELWADVLRHHGQNEALTVLPFYNGANQGSTIRAIANRYLELSDLSPETRRQYERYLRDAILPAFGSMPAEAITRTMIAAWLGRQHANGASQDVIHRRRSLLSTLLTTAQGDGAITVNHAKSVKARRPQTAEMTYLSTNEFQTLIAFVPERYKLFVKTLALTGMRVSEATALTSNRIDLDRGTITINQAWRQAASGFEIGPTKTPRSRRTIHVPAGLLTELRPLVLAAGPGGFVFTNNQGGAINRRTFNDKIWRLAVRVANGEPAKAYARGPHAGRSWDHEPPREPLSKQPRIHDLRHTHVAWALTTGQSFDLIQHNLGHASVRTTIDRYGHLDPARYTEVREALDSAIGREREDRPEEGDYDDE